MPHPHRAEALSDDERLTSVCLSRTSGPSREQRGLGRRSPRHTWLKHHFQGQKVKGQLAGGEAYCGGLPHSLFSLTRWRYCAWVQCTFHSTYIRNILWRDPFNALTLLVEWQEWHPVCETSRTNKFQMFFERPSGTQPHLEWSQKKSRLTKTVRNNSSSWPSRLWYNAGGYQHCAV